jgi:hypothetical protein
MQNINTKLKLKGNSTQEKIINTDHQNIKCKQNNMNNLKSKIQDIIENCSNGGYKAGFDREYDPADQVLSLLQKSVLECLPEEKDHAPQNNPTHSEDEIYCCLECYDDGLKNEQLEEVKENITKLFI